MRPVEFAKSTTVWFNTNRVAELIESERGVDVGHLTYRGVLAMIERRISEWLAEYPD